MFRRVVAHVRRQPVAFVALFFALTGSGFAGTKYLAVSHPITHHLAGSSYGNRPTANRAATPPARAGRPPGRPRRVRGAAPGLTNAYAADVVGPVPLGVARAGNAGGFTTVASKPNVPAGSYVVDAKTGVFLSPPVSAPRAVFCGIFASPGGQFDQSTATLDNQSSNAEETLPLQATITLGSTATVSLACAANTGSMGDANAEFAQLNLTQVDAIH